MKSSINRRFVRAMCAARGWRYAELAVAADVDLSTLSRVLNGGSFASGTLDRLALALGVSAADLIADRPIVVQLMDDQADE